MGLLNTIASLVVDPTALVAVILYDPASQQLTLWMVKHGESMLTSENFPPNPRWSISSSFTVHTTF